MFLSTVIPSDMLDVTQNPGVPQYKFSIPYNLIRGKTIHFSMQPKIYQQATSTSWETLAYSGISTLDPVYNTFNLTIPELVNEHNVTREFYLYVSYGTNMINTWGFTVSITFDILNQKIIFQPISRRFISGTQNSSVHFHVSYTVPVLINVNTID